MRRESGSKATVVLSPLSIGQFSALGWACGCALRGAAPAVPAEPSSTRAGVKVCGSSWIPFDTDVIHLIWHRRHPVTRKLYPSVIPKERWMDLQKAWDACKKGDPPASVRL